jgi:peptidoglycan DL-endopeptidase CwlO
VTKTQNSRSFRRLAALAVALSAGASVVVPVVAQAAPRTIAPATADPIAVHAANALDLLRGGTGGLKPIVVTAPPTTKPPATQPPIPPASPTSPSVPQVQPPVTLPPTGPSGDPSAQVPAPTAPPIQAPSVAGYVSAFGSGNTTRTVSYFERSGPSSDRISRFASAAAVTTSPVRLLPAPQKPDDSTATSAADATQSTTTKKKAAAKAKTTTTTTTGAPVVVGGADSTIPAVQVGPTDAPQSGAPSPAPNAPVGPLPTSFEEARRSVANAVAARSKKVDAAALDRAWANADPRRMITVFAALSQVGTPYRYAGNEPGGFDCSGLTSFAWGVAGVKIPRSSGDQIAAVNARSADALLPGDLVWRPGHIMMYIGVGDLIVDSPQTGKSITIRSWGRTSRYGSPL